MSEVNFSYLVKKGRKEGVIKFSGWGIWVSPLFFGNLLKKKNKRELIGRNQKNSVRINQKGRYKDCRKILVIEEYHHVKHVANNGKSTTSNLVALCPECHRKRHIKKGALKLDKKRTKRKITNKPKINDLSNLNNLLIGKRKKANNIWGL